MCDFKEKDKVLSKELREKE